MIRWCGGNARGAKKIGRFFRDVFMNDQEWARELSKLGIGCVCGFWNLNEKGKESLLKFLKFFKEQDEKKNGNSRTAVKS